MLICELLYNIGMENITVNIKEITYNNEEIFYHSFYKENDKVTVFSVMTDKKGK